jgi:phage shock protein PspC (stress-responsive transcriptional regulator)
MEYAVTRLPFRILAGLLGGILLLYGLPVSLLELLEAVQLQAITGSIEACFCAVCCLVGGIGLMLGAYTGRWFNSPA